MQSVKVEFPGSSGDPLAARLELPLGLIRSYAIFAHCFTCSKDLFASRRIASELAMRGIAVLRFDFTGLGASGGEFANSNFSSNVEDLRRAAQYLASHFGPAELLIGHSLGGAAVLAVAADLPEVRAVVTIGAPADTEHVIHNFRTHVPAIESHGEAEVELAGRRFTIQRQFLDDVRGQHLEAKIHNLGRPLLVLHTPGDEIVGIENARQIFAAARHPKSFLSLDGADHLLTRHEDATFVAEVVSAWFGKYLPKPSRAEPAADHDGVLVRASGEGRFQQVVEAGRHRLLADEPESYGGLDSGPSPYDFVAAGLGACTSMTLQLYAERKGWQLPPFTVEVRHAKVHAEDCVNCGEGRNGKIDQFERRITFETDPGPAVTEKIAEIADKCPVHRTLEARSHIVTKVRTSNS
ncbi:osmotically inducible protein C [Microvirga aerophila]|uniref:Osmotically inducible protein C n=2 Tax=Microvirga aerophila TaxID=670291 RepID=A0A512BLX6_9HYPH|nr:osmotically inducible protein C [Microvirga aerophila]